MTRGCADAGATSELLILDQGRKQVATTTTTGNAKVDIARIAAGDYENDVDPAASVPCDSEDAPITACATFDVVIRCQ